MQQKVLKVKLVSRKEMVQRNKYQAYGLIGNPFFLVEPPNIEEACLGELEVGVDLPTAESLIQRLYSKEASEMIIKDLRKGKDTFIITWGNEGGDIRSASSSVLNASNRQRGNSLIQ